MWLQGACTSSSVLESPGEASVPVKRNSSQQIVRVLLTQLRPPEAIPFQPLVSLFTKGLLRLF